MENEKIMVEFNQEEIDDLIDEMINIKNLLSHATDKQIKQLHKNESEDVQEMFVSLHHHRIKFGDDMINKLAPHSTFLAEGGNC